MGGSTEQGMFAEERKSRIIEFINKNEKATVTQLCDKFDVSRATIRNDLNELDEKGLIKAHPWRGRYPQSVNYGNEFFVDREICFRVRKRRWQDKLCSISEKAIVLDWMQEPPLMNWQNCLRSFQRLTIVTYDLNIAAFLDSNTEHAVFLAGGEIRKHFHYLTGEAALRELYRICIWMFSFWQETA